MEEIDINLSLRVTIESLLFRFTLNLQNNIHQAKIYLKSNNANLNNFNILGITGIGIRDSWGRKFSKIIAHIPKPVQ